MNFCDLLVFSVVSTDCGIFLSSLTARVTGTASCKDTIILTKLKPSPRKFTVKQRNFSLLTYNKENKYNKYSNNRVRHQTLSRLEHTRPQTFPASCILGTTEKTPLSLSTLPCTHHTNNFHLYFKKRRISLICKTLHDTQTSI